MSTYKQIIPSGQMATFPSGTNFQILSATNNVDVDFILAGRKVNSGRDLPASYYYRPQEVARGVNAFDQVNVTAGYGDTTIVIDISDGESGTNILSGDVSLADWVIVDEIQETNTAIKYNSGGAGDVAGHYGKVALQNPVGSGKIRYVRRLEVSRALGTIAIQKLDVFNFIADATWTETAIGAAGVFAYSGGAFGDPVTHQVTVSLTRGLANTTEVREFKNGFKLLEGESLMVRSDTPAAFIWVAFEWEDR